MRPKDNGLRDYLRANMFDGDEWGRVTMDKSTLLDEVVENVVFFLVGGSDRIEARFRDYLGPAFKAPDPTI